MSSSYPTFTVRNASCRVTCCVLWCYQHKTIAASLSPPFLLSIFATSRAVPANWAVPLPRTAKQPQTDPRDACLAKWWPMSSRHRAGLREADEIPCARVARAAATDGPDRAELELRLKSNRIPAPWAIAVEDGRGLGRRAAGART